MKRRYPTRRTLMSIVATNDLPLPVIKIKKLTLSSLEENIQKKRACIGENINIDIDQRILVKLQPTQNEQQLVDENANSDILSSCFCSTAPSENQGLTTNHPDTKFQGCTSKFDSGVQTSTGPQLNIEIREKQECDLNKESSIKITAFEKNVNETEKRVDPPDKSEIQKGVNNASSLLDVGLEKRKDDHKMHLSKPAATISSHHLDKTTNHQKLRKRCHSMGEHMSHSSNVGTKEKCSKWSVEATQKASKLHSAARKSSSSSSCSKVYKKRLSDARKKFLGRHSMSLLPSHTGSEHSNSSSEKLDFKGSGTDGRTFRISSKNRSHAAKMRRRKLLKETRRMLVRNKRPGEVKYPCEYSAQDERRLHAALQHQIEKHVRESMLGDVALGTTPVTLGAATGGSPSSASTTLRTCLKLTTTGAAVVRPDAVRRVTFAADATVSAEGVAFGNG